MDIKKTLLLILLSVISIISLRVMGEDDQSHQNIVILTNQTFEEHLWKDIAAHSKTDRIILFDQFTKELPLDQVHSLTLMFPFYKSKEEFSELWHHFIYVLSSTQQTPKKLEMLNLQWVNNQLRPWIGRWHEFTATDYEAWTPSLLSEMGHLLFTSNETKISRWFDYEKIALKGFMGFSLDDSPRTLMMVLPLSKSTTEVTITDSWCTTLKLDEFRQSPLKKMEFWGLNQLEDIFCTEGGERRTLPIDDRVLKLSSEFSHFYITHLEHWFVNPRITLELASSDEPISSPNRSTIISCIGVPPPLYPIEEDDKPRQIQSLKVEAKRF
jgi:hypothetical protein